MRGDIINMSESNTYVILISDDNMMTVTNKRRIMQRSKLVDNLWFLVDRLYNGHDMSKFTGILEYVKPISKKYKTEFLVLSNETYNDYLKYVLPFDTELTDESGDIDIQISFITTELDENGKGVQRVRKINGTKIYVTPISAWSDIIPDCALSALDQRIIKMDAQLKALGETANSVANNKADDLRYDKESRELQLLSGNKPIGNAIVLENIGYDEDGIPAVDFGAGTSDTEPDDDNSNDVVEF